MAELEKMPSLVMKKILEDCDYRGIQSLQKVCHTLRSSIDQIKPTLYFSTILLEMTSFESLLFKFQNLSIEYKKVENGCLVNQRFLENEDFMNIFSEDFKTFLNHNSEIHIFNINFHPEDIRLPENLEKILNSRSKSEKLKTENVELNIYDQYQILSVLPFFDPHSIDQLSITDANQREIFMNFEEIVKLDQWKQAKELELLWIIVAMDMKHLLHFRAVNLRSLQNLTSEDVILIKNAFFASSTLEFYCIEYNIFSGQQELLNFEFGEPDVFTDDLNLDVKQWYLRIPDSGAKNHILHIVLYSEFVKLRKMQRKDVPEHLLVKFGL